MTIFIIILFLSFIDIILTFKTLLTYRKLYPHDNKWYENEISTIPQKIFKNFGLGIKSFIISILFSFSVFIGLFLFGIKFNVPTEVFYMVIGMFWVVIHIHFYNLSELKKETKNIWDVPI